MIARSATRSDDRETPGVRPNRRHQSLYGIDLGIPLNDRRVLIGDPSAFSRKTLARFLTWIGLTDVIHAGGEAEALERVERDRPDLVLLDADHPSFDGIETCRRLRASPAGRGLPILLQTTSHSDQVRARCFQAGANDIITKPVNPGELIARVRYHLERRLMVQQLTAFQDRVERDLQLARVMQQAVIPNPTWVAEAGRRRGLSIDFRFESCDEIGGDFWSLHEVDDQRLGFLVADFCGHGISAAINAFRFHTLASRRSVEDFADPGAMLTKLNDELCEILPIGQYCTVFYGVIDRAAGTLTYAAGAQPNPLLGGAGGAITAIDGGGVFLGFHRGEIYDNRVIALEPEGFLLLYSDVLTESPDRQGGTLGEEGLTALVQQAAGAPRPLDTLLDRFAASRADRFHDDLTAIWIAWS